MIKRKYLKYDIQINEQYIIKQLVKCFVYKNSTNNLKKWKKDIYYLFNQVPYMKPFRRFPTYNQLRRWTINHFEKGLEYKIHRIIWNLPLDEYPRIFNNYEKEDIMSKFIIEYYNWLVKEIAVNGMVSQQNTYKKIDDLIVKYENEVIKNQLKINKGGK